MPVNRVIVTKNTGTKKMASSVPLIIPPNTPVPIACCVLSLAPLASISGTTPNVKAREVIRIGRKRSFAAVNVASIRLFPSFINCLANSIIRIAFLAESPIRVIRPTLKKTSFVIFVTDTASTAPSSPRGTTSMTAKGTDQLSYRAASTMNTTSTESTIRPGSCDADSFFL